MSEGRGMGRGCERGERMEQGGAERGKMRKVSERGRGSGGEEEWGGGRGRGAREKGEKVRGVSAV